jgi:CubicO group peptidase (beta-lactamase class C family)
MIMGQQDPASVGLSPARLSRIRPVMQAYIDASRYAGLITLIARHGQVAHLECYGVADREAATPLQPDAICSIASMTKPITAVAGLMLFEQGYFQLNDPISLYLPEAQNLKVFLRSTDSGVELADPVRQPTMRDLFTHTAGLSYWTPDGHVLEPAYDAVNALQPATLEQYVQAVLGLPLLHQPGSAWSYSPSLDVLACIVERITNQSFDAYVRDYIFEPLQMRDTGYSVSPEKQHRLMACYAPTTDGGLQRTHPATTLDSAAPVAYGGKGLYSTVTDYVRFAQMLLNRGHLDGVRLLARPTVDLMTSNHLSRDVLPSFDVVDLSQGYYTKGYGCGLGVRVLMNPAENEIVGSIGNFGWAGALNTYFWVDPVEELIGCIWTQSAQRMYRDPLERQFMTLAYQSIVD